ncbi:peptidylprolyl isomerase [Demequina muriae]|uniref:Peptidylprolyl isomerase n=1 Tax=Demequina muriae TaxID=3051664 RepID=A0ABT8GJV9_9MICO|nr:peptidylprolyl isomerase [Demequina sp. EGI L300058]MDN4481659.1 peptidylprolyl isomerase [Demequina sp. EGI L300058]
MSHQRSRNAAREYEKRRREALERKHAEHDQARQQSRRRWRIGAIVTAAVAAVAIVVWVLLTLLGSDDEAIEAATPSAAPSAEDTTSEPSASTPGAEPTSDELGWASSGEAPDPSLAEGRTWTASMSTSVGDIVIELDGAAAPQAVASFIALSGEGFFDQTECHRLTTAGIYVLQCGDPLGTGTGGPSYRYGPIENAPEDDVYPAGTLAMARIGGDGESMGSQFFVVYQDSTIPSDAAGGYTVFGQVVEGLSIVEGVASAGTITGEPDGRPAQSVIVNEVSLS